MGRYMVDVALTVEAPSKAKATAFAMEVVDVGVMEHAESPEDWEGGYPTDTFEVYHATAIKTRELRG